MSKNKQTDAIQLGTFDGVFTPTILTIIGVILFLRLGWVVGNVGFVSTVVIILLAHVATVSTGLALSSMATNIRIGAGGFYAILSRSLGIEVGGAIGLPLYLSQALGTALYIIGFTEVVSVYIPVDPRIISTIVLVALFILSWIGAKSAVKVQYIIMAVIAFSLVSFFMGSGESDPQNVLYTTKTDASFWAVFAIFFPAVTGISSGASMSGDLKDPRRNLPRGILSGIAVGLVIYIAVAYWFAKQATQENLLTNTLIMKDISVFSWAVIAGVIGATLSSALGSILAAPRVLQALGEDRVLPFSRIWAAKSANGEPRYALILTTAIVFVSIILADLDTIAPLLTMFFLITYGMINMAVFIEQSIGITSFRPSFKVPSLIPLVGGVWCFVVMFLINPIFASIAIVTIIAVYVIQLKRELSAPWEDVRGALFNAIAEWAAKTASKMPQSSKKAWKPNLLVPVETPKTCTSIIDFLTDIAFPKGSLRLFCVREVCGNSFTPENIAKSNSDGKIELSQQLEEVASVAKRQGIITSTTVIDACSVLEGISITTQVTKGMYFPPNIIFLSMSPDKDKASKLKSIMQLSVKEHLGIVVLGLHPKSGFGRKKYVNLWLRDKSPNLNLAILMAVELQKVWGYVRFVRVTKHEDMQVKERLNLEKIIEDWRMPTQTEVIVMHGSFKEALSKAPLADINIFGLDKSSLNVSSMQDIMDTIDTSCLFTMDSGNECILI